MADSLSVLILAAGYSSRMGKLKGLLPLPCERSCSVLKRCVDIFRDSGLENITVVSGHAREHIETAAREYGCKTVYNANFAAGMFSSIQAGVASLPANTEAFFLLPVDIPLIRTGTIQRLLLTHKTSATQILYPVFNGHRGHPPLIHKSLFDMIKRGDHCEQGLRSLLTYVEDNDPLAVQEVATCDANILFDVDTPDDYHLAYSRALVLGYPTEEECQSLINEIYPMEERGIAHGEQVAWVAVCLCKEVNRYLDTPLDPSLCYAGGLLHDIAKGYPQHEATGATWLWQLGFHQVATLVAAHKDIVYSPDMDLTEKELVHLADKVVRGSQLVKVAERFGEKMEIFKDDPLAVQAIQKRMEQALTIKKAVEALTEKSLTDIVQNRG
ncbi:DVU_1551 family NTP transferase [Desulfogranum japonicum]|uniref:DVU_1551 family NTP transferase n=1 Tax=Desulfogranum japonicum TaxID=231447 RepID=UPI00041125FF|nr:NTP transferase domain-containing protein [Desulfogranum japonicum]